MGRSNIEWCDNTLNWMKAGCTHVSEGCGECYAERYARENNIDFKLVGLKYNWERVIEEPLHRWIPTRYFVNSLADIAHEKFEQDEHMQHARNRFFDVVERCPHHIFFSLTKRPHLLLKYLSERYPNAMIPKQIWVGCSVELQKYLFRIDILRNINSQYRFVSFEPLLGPINQPNLEGISWVIVGGESSPRKFGIPSPKPRVMMGEWAYNLLNYAKYYKASYFFKQWGGREKCSCHNSWGCRLFEGRTYDEFPIEFPPKPMQQPALESFSQ